MITRVALISVGDARDPGVWSGIPWQIRSTLTAMGVDVTDVSPLRVPFARGRHLAFTAAQRIGRHYRYDLDRGSIRAMGRAANRRLSESRVDAVISTSMLPLAALRTTLPVGVWQDATIANLVETYAEYRRLSAARRRRLFAMEREILSRVTVAGYASSWAARSAIEVLGAPERRVVELPFGAGLLPRAGFDPAPALAARATDVCRLAWIGADWQRKRGDFAIAVAQALVGTGRQVHLTMVGQAPPHGTELPPFVEHVGFLPRRSQEGQATLQRLLERTHLLLLPSRAEAFGIVIAEAAAHAVPTAASDAGGIASAVLDGRTGLLLPADASPQAYAAAIGALLDDQDRYRALATAARDDHLTRLNWRSSCELLLSRLARAC